MVVSVTGHRRLAKSVEAVVHAALRTAVRRLANRHPGVTVISGMALGVDQLAALAVLEARDDGLPCRLLCAVPFRGQEEPWREFDRQVYRSILRRADQVHVLHPHRPQNTDEARRLLLTRNVWMVEQADLLLAVWDGRPGGGTAWTVRKALELGRKVARLDPGNPHARWTLLGESPVDTQQGVTFRR